MKTKLFHTLFAIIWFCVGGFLTLGIMNWYWNTHILPDMYEILDKCWETKEININELVK